MKPIDGKEIQPIAEYFNACFQADNRAHSLWDLFADKNEFLQLANVHQMDSLRQHGRCELDWVYGRQLEKNAAIYRREKMLLYGKHFVFAQLPIRGGLNKKLSRICAPLLFYEATVKEGQKELELRIERSMNRWNSQLLSLLSDDPDIELKLQDMLTIDGSLDLSLLMATLKSSCTWVTDWSLAEPITDITQLQAAKNAAKKQALTLAPGGCFVLTRRSNASRGIIDELNVMAETRQHSPAVAGLFFAQDDQGANQWHHNRCQIEHVPGVLSQAQQAALKNAAREQLSVLIGPPGTGKSYTIACIILERFLQGESVLLVTQNESAVDVVHDKLVEQLDISAQAIIRSGTKNYHDELKRKLADMLGSNSRVDELENHQAALQDIMQAIKQAENRFIADANNAVTDGLFMDDILGGKLKNHWLNRLKSWWVMRRAERQQPLSEQLSQIHDLHDQRQATLAAHINQQYQTVLHDFLQENRQHLVKFDSALRAKTSMGQKHRFLNVDYELLLKALPIWLSSLSALHRSLPMKAGLFDLVIIDEATQCDIASCLPAIHRAKRVMVVGDPKQLRHLSFLSIKKQRQILDSFKLQHLPVELNYRDQSMIDLAAAQVPSQNAVVMLDEHYRSMPAIIGFSNQQFYRNQLRVMTAKPSTAKKAAIRLLAVPHGVRENGVNVEEVKRLIEKLSEILTFQQQLPTIHRQTIGIVAFFREQADAIQNVLLDQFDLQTLRQHKIRASTPYGFQGEERDIMLLSCGVDVDTPAGAYRYLNRPDVFNVSITRARDLQYVFVSVTPDDMPKHCLLHQYVCYVKQLSAEQHDTWPRLHGYLDELCTNIEQRGMKTVHHFVVAGVVMDLVVVYKNQVLAIDLIGFPGEYHDVLHMDRYKMFSRADLSIYPLSLLRWQHHKEGVMQDLQQTLEGMHQQSLRNISIAHRTRAWKAINPIDPMLAKQVKKIEFQMIGADHSAGVKQLELLIDHWVEFHFNLSLALNEGELTWLRYRDQASAIMRSCLQRLAAITRQSGETSTEENDHLLAENRKAINQLKQASARLADVIINRHPQKVEMSYDFSELEELNRKIKQFNDMDDL